MLPLYSARVSDLKPGDFVIVECDGLIHPAALPPLGLGPNERIIDLAPRLRCRECDEKGKAVVSDQMDEAVVMITTAYHYPLRPRQGLKFLPKIFPGEHPGPESLVGKGRGCFPGTGLTDPMEPHQG